jgi:hypothetical protein
MECVCMKHVCYTGSPVHGMYVNIQLAIRRFGYDRNVADAHILYLLDPHPNV